MCAQFCGKNKDDEQEKRVRLSQTKAFDERSPSYSHSCLAAHPYRRGGQWGPAVGKCRGMQVHNENDKTRLDEEINERELLAPEI